MDNIEWEREWGKIMRERERERVERERKGKKERGENRWKHLYSC